MDDALEKIEISGATLASLLQCLSSSSSNSNLHGLLFGHLNLSPSLLSDDDHHHSISHISATVTSFIASTPSSPLYTPSAHLNLHSLTPFTSSSQTLIGWFSARLRTPLRPSMREYSVTSSLSNSRTSSPCIFLLLTTPFQDQLIHTYEYRAYQFRSSSFDPKTLDVVNIGPALGGHYTSFCPNSPFPALQCEFRHPDSSSVTDDEKLKSMRRRVLKEQKKLNMSAEGFDVLRLSRLIGSDAADYTAELEDLYNKMLAKLDDLARLVEKSSATVFEQEKHNLELRHKVAELG